MIGSLWVEFVYLFFQITMKKIILWIRIGQIHILSFYVRYKSNHKKASWTRCIKRRAFHRTLFFKNQNTKDHQERMTYRAVNSENFARILFSQIALKDLFATLKNRDFVMIYLHL